MGAHESFEYPMEATKHPQPEAVKEELARILASASFERSPRHRKFLALVVSLALQGRSGEIKEVTLAVLAFDRAPGSFDPQRDPIVRVEAARLRRKLERYYLTGGAQGTIRIAMPKGHYRPVFVETAVTRKGRRSSAKDDAEVHSIGEIDTRGLPTHSSQAGDWYFRGRYAFRQLDAAMYKKAITLFRNAIAADPGFAQAYASLAGTLLNIAALLLSPSDTLVAEARAIAQKAVALDEESAEAYTVLAACAH